MRTARDLAAGKMAETECATHNIDYAERRTVSEPDIKKARYVEAVSIVTTHSRIMVILLNALFILLVV